MTAILEKSEVQSLWARFASWVVSTENRLYISKSVSYIWRQYMKTIG